MDNYVVKVLQAVFITHDVKRFVVEKPEGYHFIPGQATEVSINLPEWKDELRPFTFTCLGDENHLEFIIKIYNDHKGVTAMLGRVNKGDELIIRDVWGAIQYKKPGIFIAGGAGITPFIAIFRDLHQKGQLKGNRLIYSNKTSEDVILAEELQEMLNDDFINIFTRENVTGFMGKRIDRKYLIENIADFGQHFYICGPSAFVKNISNLLIELGATADEVVFEK